MSHNNENVPMHLPDGATQEVPHSHTGPILGILVIVLVIILGGLYIWGGILSTDDVPPPPRTIINNEPETPRAVVDQEILETVSTSDELDMIEADLNSTNLDSLDTDLVTIDAELNAAFGE